jgi:hypothetical protein
MNPSRETTAPMIVLPTTSSLAFAIVHDNVISRSVWA